MKFYLGTHMPSWLRRSVIPLFVSFNRLRGLKSLPRAICSWSLDSSAFSDIADNGEFTSTAKEYVAAAYRYYNEIGGCEWMAIRDWMCEPWIVKKTGLSVKEHQRRTVDSYKELMDLAPNLPWMPVLQGYTMDEYRQHLDDYNDANIDLRRLPRVGVGSVCRRQHTDEIAQIMMMFAMHGLKLHGFGVKIKGLAQYGEYLVSADSMAWSKQARHEPPLKGHAGHKNCANCRTYAELWYRLQVWPLLRGLPQTRFTVAATEPNNRQKRFKEMVKNGQVPFLFDELPSPQEVQRFIEILDVVA